MEKYMTPQNVMTIFLSMLTVAGIFKQARDEKDPVKAVGGTIGIAIRYGMIVAILWWGRFYGA